MVMVKDITMDLSITLVNIKFKYEFKRGTRKGNNRGYLQR
jgi:hypothetical protein